MSEKINPEDQDANEPIKHSHYSNGVPTGREFEHLYEKVESIDKKLDSHGEQLAKVCMFIENQERAKQNVYKKAGIFSAVIGTIVAIISKVYP